jgi:hypothetical protein
MFMLSNFLIWMINNKVVQHAVLNYHANENGQPVVELTYFTPENDAVRKGWDQLSKVTGYDTLPQVQELPDQQSGAIGGENLHQNQEQPEPIIENRNEPQNFEQTINQDIPPNYTEVMDNIQFNPNDKIL